MINQYTLDRFEGLYAVLVDKGNKHNEMMVLKERLIAFAKEGDTLAIDFDSIGNLRHVEIIKSNNEEADIPEKELEGL
ncbi:DUF3006 family protein [Thalassobacillus devorans]|uniref:DUF3006 family protein n=1 Tax=Thalassobacillus devorans TaxID=279813 RepID=UPI0020CB58DC|nr:DUF3006 family protein [Thalassobacillus devorans]